MKAQIKSKLNCDNRVALQEVIPLDVPYLLYVDPSSACNFRCQFCPTGHKDLIRGSDYVRSTLNYDLFKKLIVDLEEFDRPIKVMRMNKIGEPLLNKNLPKMIGLAKSSGLVEYIDLATNGALFSEELLSSLIEAGLDRINISLEGVNRQQYIEHAKVDIDFEKFVKNVQWLYTHKNGCEVTIKVPGNYLNEQQKQDFLNVFGDYCDRIFIEELAPIWPAFDLEKRAGFALKTHEGQYQQPLVKKDVCTYIFYAMAINADGSVSACCPDWDQKLVIGNVKEETLKKIWRSPLMNAIRRQHLEGRRFENSICNNCGHIDYAQVDNVDSYKDMLLKKLAAYERET